MVLFTAGLQGISKDLYEAADMEGCSHIEKIRYVTLPGLKNTFVYVMTMTTLSCFNVMGQPMMLTPGDESTQVAIQFIYNTALWWLEIRQSFSYEHYHGFIDGCLFFFSFKKSDSIGEKRKCIIKVKRN